MTNIIGLHEGPRVVKFLLIEVEWWLPGVGGRGGKNGELFFNGYRVSVWEDEKLWRGMVVMIAQTMRMCLTLQNCTLNNGSISKFCYIYFTIFFF